MKPKPITPYQRLKDEAKEWAFSVVYPWRRQMWRYPKEKLNREGGWSLSDLWERVAAAEQLGHVVQLKATDEGLIVEYIRKAPDAPWSFRP